MASSQSSVIVSGPYIPPIDNTDTQHHGTDSLAINNTFLRRLFTLLALKTTARFYRYDGPCIPISKHLIVKWGPFIHLTEAATMRFIASNTSIPVPRVHCSFVHRNRAFILMERVQGSPLPDAWKTLSDADRASILAQIQQMVRELRSLQPPLGAGVESSSGGSLRDSRISHCRPRFGPFKTIQDFHLWLREELRPEEHPDRTDDQDWKDIKDMVAKQDGPWPAPVFTHGDLNPFNIIVQGNRVVSIIDWEFAGWYPHYWEYTSAWHGNILRKEWQDIITSIIDQYPEELKMETTRHKWWGEF